MNINKSFGQSEPVFIEDELQWLSAWQICAASATLPGKPGTGSGDGGAAGRHSTNKY